MDKLYNNPPNYARQITLTGLEWKPKIKSQKGGEKMIIKGKGFYAVLIIAALAILFALAGVIQSCRNGENIWP